MIAPLERLNRFPPIQLLHVGVPAPPETRHCPAVPTADSAKALAPEYAIAPFATVRLALVPPFANPNIPVTSVFAKLIALVESTPAALLCTIPALLSPLKVIAPDEVNPVKPVNVPLAIKLDPCAVNATFPAELMTTFPALAPPKVNVCPFVVVILPVAVNDKALFPVPEI